MLTLYKDTEQATIQENIKLFLKSMQEREGVYIWMVLESSRDRAIKSFLIEHEDTSHYLFRDDVEELQEAGAVAICLNDAAKAWDWVATHWGNNWFSFFVTSYDSKQVVSHLSSLCYLSNKENTHLFRYYDPVTFTCWVRGLNEQQRIDEALGFFSEVYVETPLPHMLRQYTFNQNKSHSKEIDLQDDLNNFSFPLIKKENKSFELAGSWLIKEKEFESLAPVSINNFKIKLCKTLVQEYKLTENLSLTEVYGVINNEVSRVTRHGFTKKHLIANFVNIYFEYPKFWKERQPFIQETLEQRDLGEVDILEMLLKEVSEDESYK